MKNTKKLYESIMSSVAKQVKKALNESADGWDLDQFEDAFNNIESFIYEVRNCVRGAYTNCYTYAELADELRSIANSLSSVADEIENISEPEPEDEEEFEDDEYDE